MPGLPSAVTTEARTAPGADKYLLTDKRGPSVLSGCAPHRCSRTLGRGARAPTTVMAPSGWEPLGQGQ